MRKREKPEAGFKVGEWCLLWRRDATQQWRVFGSRSYDFALLLLEFFKIRLCMDGINAIKRFELGFGQVNGIEPKGGKK